MEKNDDGKENVTWEELTTADKIPDSFNDDRAGGKGHFVPEPTAAFKNKRKVNKLK